jgi:plasmid stabilization system protein ParE
MRGLVWLDSAVNDLARLREFIVEKNPDAAARAAKAIKQGVQLIVGSPSIGKPVLDLPDYRDLLIRFGAGGYVLRYRVHLDVVYAVHLRHYRELDFKL